MENIYTEILIIGGGHAGIEAANSLNKIGKSTVLLTMDSKKIGAMSCNPAIGGLAKGHIVKEIEALGGIMGVAADEAGLQFRRLNTKKGAAVRATRAQIDRDKYIEIMTGKLVRMKNVTIVEDEATELVVESGKIAGVITRSGRKINCMACILTTGTFLNGLLHFGPEKRIGGRIGDRASLGLTESINKQGIRTGRLKTGTPPRLEKESIDFSVLQVQPGDEPAPFFTNKIVREALVQQNCYITYTNRDTHDIIRANIEKSPMYSGEIVGIGPRYCPSIEDKVVRFSDKDRHQIFLEPEGLNSEKIYPNGISTSLPEDVQIQYVRSIKGLEAAVIIDPGYAVEYDFVFPTQLKISLESKAVENLFFAGQINGTSGYEEAAGQGLVAGVNAAAKLDGKNSLVIGRDEGYIGVLIDDLVTKGTNEPYRMFTSRAEYRLTLREDNAILRLAEKAFEYRMIDEEEYHDRKRIESEIKSAVNDLDLKKINPKDETILLLKRLGYDQIKKQTSLKEILRRPNIQYDDLTKIDTISTLSQYVKSQVEIEVKYEGYLKREREMIERSKRDEENDIPDDLNYDDISGLKTEVKEKLKEIRPKTMGQALRIPGITPAAISVLQINLKKMGQES